MRSLILLKSIESLYVFKLRTSFKVSRLSQPRDDSDQHNRPQWQTDEGSRNRTPGALGVSWD